MALGVTNRWAAESEQELAQWSHEERESRIVFARLEEWKGFHEHAQVCIRCRRQNLNADIQYTDIRQTIVGELCMQCWLDWPACEVCGVGPAAVDERGGISLVFQGKVTCADCLVPEIPRAWDDWQLMFFATPKSSYQRVFEAYPLTWGE